MLDASGLQGTRVRKHMGMETACVETSALHAAGKIFALRHARNPSPAGAR